MNYQDQMIALMEESFHEGEDSRNSACEQQLANLEAKHKAEIEELDKAHAKELQQEYQRGVDDTLSQTSGASQQPAVEPQSNMPIHNVENRATFDFYNQLPPEGYAADDHSLVWPYLTMVQEDHVSWTGRPAPYCIYGAGDTVIVECDDEPSQTILPYKPGTGFFRIYLLTPGKIYRWKLLKSGKVVKSGQFRTEGRVRWIGTDHPHNFRDIGGFTAKFGRVYRAMNLKKVEVGDDDYNIIRNHLNISVQINLTTKSDTNSPSRTDIFDRCYNFNIPAYASLLTATSTNKGLFKSAFETLVTELEDGNNVIFNCWQGADRTGTFAWFLQAILSVPLGYCVGFWELTGYARDKNSKIWDWEEQSGGELRTFITKLIAKYVADKTVTDKSYDSYKLAYYLATKIIGISAQTIADFRTIMLTPVQ